MKRGFGSPNYDRERQRAAASLGGHAAWRRGVAHRWTSETAQAAGRKGGVGVAKRKWLIDFVAAVERRATAEIIACGPSGDAYARAMRSELAARVGESPAQ